MRRSLGWSAKVLLVIAALAIGVSRADAITLAEIIQLTKAGLDEDVLLALIEVDQRVFAIDPDTMKELKAAGVSPRVIVAIVKSGRTPQPRSEPSIESVPPDPPQPQVVVVDRPVIQEVPVAVPVPVYIAVGGYSRGRFTIVRTARIGRRSHCRQIQRRRQSFVRRATGTAPTCRAGVLGLGRKAPS